MCGWLTILWIKGNLTYVNCIRRLRWYSMFYWDAQEIQDDEFMMETSHMQNVLQTFELTEINFLHTIALQFTWHFGVVVVVCVWLQSTTQLVLFLSFSFVYRLCHTHIDCRRFCLIQQWDNLTWLTWIEYSVSLHKIIRREKFFSFMRILTLLLCVGFFAYEFRFVCYAWPVSISYGNEFCLSMIQLTLTMSAGSHTYTRRRSILSLFSSRIFSSITFVCVEFTIYSFVDILNCH